MQDSASPGRRCNPCFTQPVGVGSGPIVAILSYRRVRIHRCMGTKTISLELSAYERLRAAKREGESFSAVVHRLTKPSRRSLRELSGILDPATAAKVEESIAEMRSEDIATEKLRRVGRRTRHGRSSR